MARFKDREKALELRKLGLSYSQIKETLEVSKSTLSIWLRNYPLSRERINELRARSERRIERFRETMRAKREKRLLQFYLEEKNKILPLSKRDLFIAGLFLYWGEGSKRIDSRLVMSNTDPAVIKFFIKWAIESLGVPSDKFRVGLQLYSDMNVDKEVQYWSNILNIPRSQFIKPYIKRSVQIRINHKGAFGRGTCNISIYGTRMAERLLMGIKTVSDSYGPVAQPVRAFGL